MVESIMVQENREKRYWFIPKRANVHQMLAFIHGMIIRNYNGQTWNTSKQDTLNLELSKLGATRNGKKISPQGMRTLLASVHYLGFVYLDNSTTPTTIHLTNAGIIFYEAHKNQLVKIDSLGQSDKIVKSSRSVLSQFNKLQITNPIILKDCEDIFVFPFRVTLKIILELGYLDIEEIALYVFNIKEMLEIDKAIKEIEIFRNLDEVDRRELISSFKKTQLGSISLVKAPSSGYFIQFCVATGLFESQLKFINNLNRSVNVLQLKENSKDEAIQLYNEYKNINTYDFKENLMLWIQYFGDPKVNFPPISGKIKNNSGNEIYIEIVDSLNLNFILSDIIPNGSMREFPTFENFQYIIKVFDVSTGNKIHESEFLGHENLVIDINEQAQNIIPNSFAYFKEQIIAHSQSTNFDGFMLSKLELLKRERNIDKLQDKSLRGAYYEYLFSSALLELVSEGIIDDAYWNGSISNYSLPVSAPGSDGRPDIVFIIDDIHYVLELTTIKSKSMQERAEMSSVPQHIIKYAVEHPSNVVRGIFCAPIIHERVNISMLTNINSYHKSNVSFVSLSDTKLLEIFSNTSKQGIIDSFDKEFFLRLKR